MKNRILILLMVLFAAGCSAPKKKDSAERVVLVSILPQKTFVEKIAGSDFQVTVLIPHGANPTTFSLLPAQMSDIARAGLWFRMGYVGFELSWGEKIRQANEAMKIVDLSQGLDLITATQPVATSSKAGIDPHTWMAPSQVRQMARTIRDELTSMYPGESGRFQSGYLKFLKEIDETDLEVRKILSGFQGRRFISFHPSLSYFAREYQLEQLSVQQAGKEPTPSHMARLVDVARNDKISTIFIQSDFDREQAAIFARETGAEVVQTWPLNPAWSENMITIAHLIADSFK